MSATSNKLELSQVVNTATPEEQRTLLRWLLARFVAEKGPEPQLLQGNGSVPLGVFIPNANFPNKPPMSDEQYAEFLQSVRNTTDDQLLTAEELIQELESVDARQSNAR